MAEFIHQYYKDFIDNTNIKDGGFANQRKLNESVNTLKKEVDNLYNREQIIRGAEGFQWKSFTNYVPGEIVWYNGDAYRAELENYNQVPYPTSGFWHFVYRDEYTLDLDPLTYLHINRTEEYIPIDSYNPATKKYVDDTVAYASDNGNFLALNRTLPYQPTGDYQPATKIYVDGSIGNLLNPDSTLRVSKSSDALTLNSIPSSGYVQAHLVGEYNGFGVNGNTNSWLRTTSAGLLPIDQSRISSHGTVGWEFKECHAVNFYGNSSTAKYADLAEKYLPDNDYEVGTILGIGGINEVTLFEQGMPVAGVVSDNPAYMMNGDLYGGVYIALKGRVYVKIMGSAKKGQYINAYGNGKGIPSKIKNDLTIGVCLADGTDLVEVKV